MKIGLHLFIAFFLLALGDVYGQCNPDIQNPVINCPSTAVPIYLDANCQGQVPDFSTSISVVDNCDPNPSSTQSPAAGTTVFGVGSGVQVGFFAMDASMNGASCTFTAITEDSLAPTIMCPINQVLMADANCQAILPDYSGQTTASDNCSQTVTLSQSPAPATMLSSGLTTVTMMGTDGFFNTGTCTFTVDVVDNTPPMAICANNIAYLDNVGFGGVASGDVDGGSTDNCGIVSFNIVPTTFDCSNLGNNVVVYTIEDAAGNQASCTSNISVQDTTSPIAMCTPITVFLDGTGNASADPNTIGNGSIDNCQQWSFSLSQSMFTTADLGTNSVVLTVTDSSGNTSTCTTTVEVQDSNMTAISDGLMEHLTIAFFPNPTDGVVLLRWEDANSYLGEQVKIRVTNTLGQLILQEKWIVGSNLEEHRYDLKSFPNGTYIFELELEAGNLYRKVLKH